MTKYTNDSSNFGADGPFFRVIREGLKGLIEGDDYFDLLADDVVFEYVISVPSYPRRVQGRQSIIDLYSGYDDYMRVHSADSFHRPLRRPGVGPFIPPGHMAPRGALPRLATSRGSPACGSCPAFAWGGSRGVLPDRPSVASSLCTRCDSAGRQATDCWVDPAHGSFSVGTECVSLAPNSPALLTGDRCSIMIVGGADGDIGSVKYERFARGW
jgi:hypothetical protein